MEHAVLTRVRDHARLNALHRLSLLDSAPEEAFDRYTRLASTILSVPMSLVSFVDADRQFFKSGVGLEEPLASCRQTPLSHSFCKHVVATERPLVVSDARIHEVVRDNLAIPDFNVIAYLGIPLKTSDGLVLGSFCVINTEPREWSDKDVAIMTDLAGAVSTEIELRKEMLEHRANAQALQTSHLRFHQLNAALPVGVFVLDAQGRPFYANDAAKQMLGRDIDNVTRDPQSAEVYRVCVTDTDEPYPVERMPLERALAGQHTTVTDMEICHPNGRISVEVSGTPVRNDAGEVVYALGVFTDISDRQRALATLRLRERALAASTNSIVIADALQPDLPIIYVNAAFTMMTGYNVEEVIGRNCRFLQGPDTDPDAVAVIRQAVRAGHATETTLLNYRKDGTTFWNTLTLAPVHDAQGRVTHFVCVQRDVTAAKLAEAEQRATSEHLQFQANVIERINDAVIVTDSEWRIKVWNKMAEQMYGWSAVDAIGRTMQEVTQIHECLDDTSCENAEVVLLQKGLWQGEAIQTNRVGNEVIVDASIQVIRDEDEHITGIVAINRDISERIQARAALRESDQRTADILASISDGFVALDNDLCFTYVNSKAEGLLQRSQSELLGQSVWEVFPSAVDLPFHGHFTTAFATQTAKAFEAFYSPLEAWREISVYPSRTGLSIYFRDITARKQKAAELMAMMSAAEAANRAKSEFLATMSHELRTPLNSVIGMNELLLATRLTTEQQELAAMARDSGQILLALLNDILDFSKLEAGKLEVELADINLTTLVEDTVETFMPHVLAKDLMLDLYVAPNVPTTLSGDARRLRQILFNLVGNAVKFTGRGSVTVHVACEERTVSQVTIRVEITDTGIGIADTALPKLFQPFTQGDGSMARRFGGTGLGLSICRRLVELMGGDIGVISKEGEGSTFWFTVALKTVAIEDTMIPGATLTYGRRALLIADSAKRCGPLDQYLTASGMHVDVVDTLQQAADHMRTTTPAMQADLVIIDQSWLESIEHPLADASQTLIAAWDVPAIVITAFNVVPNPMFTALPSFVGRLKNPIRRSVLDDMLVEALCKKRCGASVLYPPQKNQADDDFSGIVSATVPSVRVLIAEDNPFNQKLALAQLKKLGYAADAVGTGREAVEAVRTGAYALVLMDCQMPEMDGFDATKIIRQLEGRDRYRLPIIALTANTLPEDEATCLRSGMDAYLAKPVKLDQLKAMLERWLSTEQGNAVGGWITKHRSDMVHHYSNLAV